MTDAFHSVPSPLQGKVSIAVKSGVKLEIPDGVVLQNKACFRVAIPLYFARTIRDEFSLQLSEARNHLAAH
ncbi:hypothetical protein POTOM_006134 [Populus tomentosa]|uniref:Uncharacterized protein n=1 Tax=Populus tomentosa TaxID=118781 RepID=A0A8X8AKG8_POPTO|nr:hypothetical protein POTOM_006134 [Populus tomentosa]